MMKNTSTNMMSTMNTKRVATPDSRSGRLPWVSLAVLSTCLLVAAGCSNPADDVAEAQTGEAEPVPSAASPAATDGATATTGPAAAARVYTIAPESTIGFVGSKVTGSHEGGFKTFTGTFTAADGQLAPVQTIQIDMTSLWADNDRLAGHLKNEDFFDVGKFPTATFTSTSIVKSDAGHTVTGNLNLHGVTKSISFPATIAVTDSQVTVKAEFFIRRFDFGIVYKGRADDLIRDEVVIKLDVVAKAG